MLSHHHVCVTATDGRANFAREKSIIVVTKGPIYVFIRVVYVPTVMNEESAIYNKSSAHISGANTLILSW